MFNWEKKLQYCKTYIQSFLIRSLDHVGMYSRRPSVLSFLQKYFIDLLNLLLFNFINLNTLEFLCIHTFRWRIRITLKKIKDFKLPQHIYRQHFHSLFCNIDFLEKLLTPLIFYSEPIEFLKVVKASLVRVWKQFSVEIQLKNGWKVALKAAPLTLNAWQTKAKQLAERSLTRCQKRNPWPVIEILYLSGEARARRVGRKWRVATTSLEKCNKHLANFSHLMLRQTEKLLKIYLSCPRAV